MHNLLQREFGDWGDEKRLHMARTRLHGFVDAICGAMCAITAAGLYEVSHYSFAEGYATAVTLVAYGAHEWAWQVRRRLIPRLSKVLRSRAPGLEVRTAAPYTR
jgi:hypothetical protein